MSEDLDYKELYEDVRDSGDKVIELINKLANKLDDKHNEGIIVNIVRLSQYVSSKIIFALSVHYGRTPNEELVVYNESMLEAIKMFQVNKEALN